MSPSPGFSYVLGDNLFRPHAPLLSNRPVNNICRSNSYIDFYFRDKCAVYCNLVVQPLNQIVSWSLPPIPRYGPNLALSVGINLLETKRFLNTI
jgi:hypothetical protein